MISKSSFFEKVYFKIRKPYKSVASLDAFGLQIGTILAPVAQLDRASDYGSEG